ncbi:MAG: endolytic transglycosylase MltG [bacterium]|nr:endolytic transglycosylase MltG [bacterium]
MHAIIKFIKFCIIFIAVIVGVLFVTPFLVARYINITNNRTPSFAEQFPVTVDPINKTITEDERVNTYFHSQNFNVQAAALFLAFRFEEIYLQFIAPITAIMENNNLALLALVSNERFVTITSGLRKEEVANAFARALGWNNNEKKEFTTLRDGQDLPLFEGSFSPGIYAIKRDATPNEAQEMVNKRFTNNVLARYGTSTAEIVPLNMALTIASLIERETIGTDDMRIISGIIWNRIFKNMNLQLDATLQYVKVNNKKTAVWWPEIRPQDKFIKSPYNTYMFGGLPPTPIANPSIAAIVAALNPVNTTCIFYFHDDKGDLHCTPTYKEHVALLKQYYGRGR